MKKQTLKFLYTRLKTLQLSRKQAESKVCQEIFISKISANNEIRDKVDEKNWINISIKIIVATIIGFLNVN